MRLRVNRLSLVGGGRDILFRPGLNVITGPITTGKTTTLRLISVLLGSAISGFVPEVRQNVRAVSGELTIGPEEYSIARQFVTTPTSRVSVAGPSREGWRLPALQSTDGTQTYGQWLLEQLGLPILEVPIAPTRLESGRSPLSINDYLTYCELAQDEIDQSVFEHTDPLRNNKRRFIFQVIYGIYGTRLAELDEQRRSIQSQVRRLREESQILDRLLRGTPLENRARLDRDLAETRTELEAVTAATKAFAIGAQTPEIERLQLLARELDTKVAAMRTRRQDELSSAAQLRTLLDQLEAQTARLTRTLVADQFLVDFEFLMCPRCGASINQVRGDAQTCMLCLQEPRGLIHSDEVFKEQDRLVEQVGETRQLVEVHDKSADRVAAEIDVLLAQRKRVGADLDVVTNSFVSDAAADIAQRAAQRAALQARVDQLTEYSNVLRKLEAVDGTILEFQNQLAEIESQIQVEQASRRGVDDRIKFLEQIMNRTLDEIGAPRFAEDHRVLINRTTYLPEVDGRRFDDLSSQGLKVLVNLAHAMAHQITAIELDLPLPNLLLIDGLTSNVGHEGFDMERVRAVYRLLQRISEQYRDRLQIIVADSEDLPAEVSDVIRLHLTEKDKLIKPTPKA